MNRTLSPAPVLAIMLWSSTILIACVHAQQEQTPGAPTAQNLTNAGLNTMLANMGYEPKSLSKGFLIVPKVGTWTLNIQVVLSSDLTKVGLNANLGKIDDLDSVPAQTWLKLLIAGGDRDPSYFYVDKDQRKLYLHRSFDNRAVTPAVLRSELDSFSTAIRETEDLWKFTK